MTQEQALKWHQEVFDLFNVMFNNRIIASYIGPFDKQVLITLAQNLKDSLLEDATQAKKFFKIFVELAHNIALYSVEKEDGAGTGTIIVNEFPEYLVLSAGNMVTIEHKETLEAKCDLINSLNREELRKLKRYLLRLPPKSPNSGNIGLVQIALVSRYPLEYKFFPLDETGYYYFYIISVKIDKRFRRQ